jgi:1,2-diacylglycerol 3-beta-galactosyltransferase
MVDIMKSYGPPVVNRLPEWYPWMVSSRGLWKLMFRVTDGLPQVKLGMSLLYPYIRRDVKRIISENPCDLFVSVHPGATYALMRLMKGNRLAFVSVVTELTNVHAVWYHPPTDLCLVPTEAARQRALKYGWPAEKVQVVGLPVSSQFCQPAKDRAALRQELDWPQDRLVVLLMGGGEGMGPLEETACAIAEDCPEIALAMVAGRNQGLRAALEARSWPIPVRIYGFTNQVADFMQAADILVTKGGPGTVSEALNASLPMIIYTYLPGQEEGNVAYIVENGAGVYAPGAGQIVSTIRDWIDDPSRRKDAAAACKHLARPDAARRIAHILADIVC